MKSTYALGLGYLVVIKDLLWCLALAYLPCNFFFLIMVCLNWKSCGPKIPNFIIHFHFSLLSHLIICYFNFSFKKCYILNSLLGSWSYHGVLYPLFCPTFSFDARICIQLKAIASIPIKRASLQEVATLWRKLGYTW